MRFALLLAFLGCSGAPPIPDGMAAYNDPAEPFRVIGNLSSVGTSEIGVYLVDTPAGHVLIDSAFEQSVPAIEANVRRLGFRFEDVKVLLSTQAHMDHVGGHARVRSLTGARVLVSAGDAELVRRGGGGPLAFGMTWRACPVDGIVEEGTHVELGGVVLTAHLTPGHSPGATTWTMRLLDEGRALDVVFFPSGTVPPGVRLRDNPAYPQVVRDYEASFAAWKAMPCDVVLAPHVGFVHLAEKRRRLGERPNPFIDPEGWRRLVATQEQRFREQLAEETRR